MLSLSHRERETKSMVAISLYRGNLHRVPEVPRRWLMPPPKISLKDFKTLLNRRNRALARLRSPNIATSNPNSNSGLQLQPLNPTPPDLKLQLDDNNDANGKEDEGIIQYSEINNQGKSNVGDYTVKPAIETEIAPEKAFDTVVTDEKLHSLVVVEKPAEPVNPNLQVSKTLLIFFLVFFTWMVQICLILLVCHKYINETEL